MSFYLSSNNQCAFPVTNYHRAKIQPVLVFFTLVIKLVENRGSSKKLLVLLLDERFTES